MPGQPRTTSNLPFVWQRLQVTPQVGRPCPRRPTLMPSMRATASSYRMNRHDCARLE